MAANEAQQGPPPDFDVLARDVHSLMAQLARLGNLEGLGERVTGMGNDLDHQLGEISRRLGEIDRRLTAVEHTQLWLQQQQLTLDRNNQARIFNGHVREQGEELAPLYSVRTHDPIPNFPTTIARLDGLRSPDMRPMLEHMNVSPDGTDTHIRWALGQAFGLLPSITHYHP
ncbi:hypothetical protein SLS58_011068 [Diplodia intermedia]|uniref:Uncharacterized protein n=1 Tax=Diplodia intermedia TaxID=856260 RepID=A0ABR3T1X6_9PEZI